MKKPTINLTAKSGFFSIVFLFVIAFTGCIFDPVGPASLLDRVKQHPNVAIDFNADIESNSEFLSFSSLSADNSPPLGSSQNHALEWNGTSFSVTFDYSYDLFSGEPVRYYGTISGTMSDDGEKVETFTANYTEIHQESGDVYKGFLSVIDVPYPSDYTYDEYTPRYSVEGPSVSNHIYSYSQSWEFVDSDGNQQMMYNTSVNYNDPDDVPYLYITFSGG